MVGRLAAGPISAATRARVRHVQPAAGLACIKCKGEVWIEYHDSRRCRRAQLTRSTACASLPFSTSFCTTCGRAASNQPQGRPGGQYVRQHGRLSRTGSTTCWRTAICRPAFSSCCPASSWRICTGHPMASSSTTRQRFWWQRFTRIYPVHLIVLSSPSCSSCRASGWTRRRRPIAVAAASAVATATLTQAWFPPLVPIWSWPTWALSAVVFLYLVMPWLMRVLSKLSRRQQIGAAGGDAADFADSYPGVPAVLPGRWRGTD